MKSVLLIAFHFPPIQGSSGVQRTLRFAEYLPEFGWRPIVLTIDPRAYEATVASTSNAIPPDLEVHRAFGLDAARHLSVFGRYPRMLALPDRWATWRLAAVRRAMQIIRRQKVDAVWSTFPIATAHRVGQEVARRSGLPWVAEFRDPMWQGEFPPDPVVNRFWRKLETEVFEHAARVVVTTQGTARLYEKRFPGVARPSIAVIENGYDESTFTRAGGDAGCSRPAQGAGRHVKLLHSGILYRSERDPTQFFAAITALKRSGSLVSEQVQIVFRASGDDAGYRRDVAALGIDDIVRFEPAIGYQQALEEMLAADGLLIFQASNCNEQIPAKLYEYLRAQRPILALTDPVGDTAHTLRSAGTGMIVRLDSAEDIQASLPDFLDQIREDSWTRCTSEVIARYSRRSQTLQLARLLESSLPGA